MKTWRNRIVGMEMADPASLLANEKNWRVHPKHQQDVMDETLDRVGFVRTVLVNLRKDDSWGNRRGIPTVLDGHLRAKRAISTGQREIPITYVDLTEEEENYVLATLDPIAQLAAVDRDMLGDLIVDIPDIDPSTLSMLNDLVGEIRGDKPGEQSDEDSGTKREAPDLDKLVEKWGVEDGSVWRIPSSESSDHYYIVGDSREQFVRDVISDLGITFAGAFTSPPYAEQRDEHYQSASADEFTDWFEPIQKLVHDFLEDDGSFFVNIKDFSKDYVRSTYVHELVVAMAKRWGWTYLDEFCWERAGIPGDPYRMGKFKNQWEPVFWWAKQTRPFFEPNRVMHKTNNAVLDDNWMPTASKNQGVVSVMGDREKGEGMAYPGNRLKIHAATEVWGHPAAFTPELPSFFMVVYSNPSDYWLDMFGGSGSVMVAAEKLSRSSVLVDSNPKYVALTLERYLEEFGHEGERVR